MKRIMIVGCSGSGKSTFARKLHEKTGLPLYHLDNIWWNPDRTHITREEFDEKLSELVSRDSWIIDGDYSRTYEVRLAACDTIFFLDYSPEVCMEGIISRVGKERPDMPWVEDTVDPELAEMVKNYQKENKPRLEELLRKYPEKRVVVMRGERGIREKVKKCQDGK